MFVKVLPIHGVMRFEKASKLASEYVGPFPMAGIGKFAYRVNLPSI